MIYISAYNNAKCICINKRESVVIRLTVFTVEAVVGGWTAAVVNTDHFVARPIVPTRSARTL